MFVVHFSPCFVLLSCLFTESLSKCKLPFRRRVLSVETVFQRRRCSLDLVILAIRDDSCTFRIPFLTRLKTLKLFFRIILLGKNDGEGVPPSNPQGRFGLVKQG